ncbi:Glutamine-rich protein 2, partial [Acanthisitta chloris]
QVERECEQLSSVMGNLQRECQQKQKAVQMLLQSLERLQKEKADKKDLLAALDAKVDKADLGSKVDCSQFEVSVEQLKERMWEMQGQVSGQEDHWRKLQQQLTNLREDKVDCLELKVFRKHLEASWNRTIAELEQRMLAMTDSTAGVKKQLLAPFSCLSCDRMVTAQAPG